MSNDIGVICDTIHVIRLQVMMGNNQWSLVTTVHDESVYDYVTNLPGIPRCVTDIAPRRYVIRREITDYSNMRELCIHGR